MRLTNCPLRLSASPRLLLKPFIGCLLLFFLSHPDTARACCAVSAAGVPAINGDQDVIIIWDRERQTEHFIRQASFLAEGDSVGFIVPSPSRPQLEEAGNQAFPYLAEITAPKQPARFEVPLGCSADTGMTYSAEVGVRVIEEKTVAGYDAVVLTADSGHALVAWLRNHDYAFTPEVAAWAQPYVEQGWYMTAMKIAKNRADRSSEDLAASALRITFQTDRPLFPYREPDSRREAAQLKAPDRLLRIYFIAESRYEGLFPSAQPWSGETKWSRPLASDQRAELLRNLNLPPSTGPAKFWLTKFEDHWPYGQAPGDVYFSKSANQRKFSNNAKGVFDPTLVVVGLTLLFIRLRRKV